MELKFLWVIISLFLTIVVFIPYLIDIFKKKTKPHMYSWLVWGILQVIGPISMFKGGAGWGALPLAVGGFFCLTIFGLSFKYGTKNIKKFDLYCLIASLFAIAVYLLVEDPLYSIILVTIIDLVAFLPTFRKGFEEPFSETLATWLISAIANLFIIFSLQYYSVTTLLYTSSLVITNSIICTILITRRKILRKSIII